MIAAAFLVLLRPYSIQCALFLLLLLLGTIATILFFCCWHRKLQKGRHHPIKSVFSGRSRSRDAVMRTHHFRSEVIYLARNLKGFRPSPRHIRRRVVPRLEETQPLVEAHQLSEQETLIKKRKIKKSSRVQPEFYHSVQVTPTRKPSSGTASYRCSMSSSADFSDDDDFSQKSGSLSPAPGDTLPWNLPKHERSKRKIQGGSVLDPAERAVLRIADERDKVQKKTFTKWINQHLMKIRKHVNDLYEDLRDGHNLISLLEVLSGDTLPRERDFLKTLRLVSSTEACPYEQHEDEEDEDKGPREKGRMRFHRLQNVQIALDYLKRRQVKLVNIRNDDITDGNPKLTLGLIWTIILHFQISDIHVTGESEDMSAKERLLLWTQQTTEGYAGIRCENFTTCWRDGKLFNAIIHKYRPDLIDMNTVAVQSNLANLEHAFFVAEKLGVARLLDPEDVDVSSPDEKSVITYVSSLYDAFPKVPEGGEGISAHDVEVKWVEYQNMVNYLIQWIRHHATMMADRVFPNNPVELKALYNQYLQFKETEIPPKEIDKSKIKHLYKLLEVWIEFGRIKLPQGYHPNDIEKEWGKLIIAMLEREKTLRPEVERLEMLQQIANRVQRDSLNCEDKLMLARNAVQSDAKRLESGLQFQNEAEIAGYLLECENLLCQQVMDAQNLIDGKYYQADQLVQRVAKLRDDLMALRAEYSSVYSRGRTLTTEQTKMMISGITQSLNSGFAPNLSPSLNSGLSQGLLPSLTSSSLTSGLSSGLSSRLTPAITPAYTPGFPPRLIQSYITGVDTSALQTLKLMQIRKPLMKSAFIDQNLTEEEVNMKFVQDLLRWVDEMQVQLDQSEWGSDLPSVESHLENHKNVHKAIEEFESSLKEAKISEIQMTAPLKLSYAEKLHKLESQYAKLLNTSRNQERHLDTLHNFVSRATRELIWLNEKEEEEVAYDWSERNTNIARKKEYHAELMRELDQKEEIIKSVQEIAEQLLFENHPARLTIEAYRAAMQTQWSWILQLCQCVEQHLRENTAYFQFFNDAKEAIDYLKNLRDAVHRKYSCDRSSSIHKLEHLIQESMDEKEQLLQYKNTVAGLVGRAKTIIQLKPRNPDNPLKTSLPIKAICDYRQIEITIYKDDECVLASNSHRAKWKVISPSGNEAMVPSVCFTVPPPNKEAIDTANRIEQQYQNVLALWHESHINMKSVVSWHYLTNEIETVRASNVASIKTLLPGEHQQVLSNLHSRFDDFLEDSQKSKIFSVADIAQLEREVNVCKQYYQELLKSAEREEHEESIYNLYISDVRNIRLRLENCEDRLIRQIRTPLERDDLHESVFRISEQENLKKELDRLKEDLETITDKCDDFFSQASGSPSIPTLRSELNLVIQNMNQIYSMSSIYIEKLKTVNLVLKNTQGAEALVKLYETKLCEEEPLTADKSNIENLMGTLKQWRSEVDVKREVFHALEDELQKAKAISDQMFKTHKERDIDFDWHKEKADQLTERWQNVHSQIENRLRDLEGINKSLKYYRDTYGALDNWIKQVEETQQRFQENPPQNSKALAKQLNQQKMLVSEIEMKQNKLDECQKYSEQYSAAVKDYELQTMTYRAMVDSQQKSPVKRRRMQSSSDFIIQEFMDLRTRYTALVTLMTQYIKFASDSLKRLEEEEKSVEEEKKEHVEKAGDLLKWVSNITKNLGKNGGEKPEKADFHKKQISSDELSTKKEQISEALQTTQSFLAKHGDKMTDEGKNEMENYMKSLQEGYKLLSNEDLKQLQQEQNVDNDNMDEKVDKIIAGVIDQTTGEMFSVLQAIYKGLIDYDTGIQLLQSQLILSGLISPALGRRFDLEEAKAHELVDEQAILQLQGLQNAKMIISELQLTTLPVVAALEEDLISESLAIKILEIQLSRGHLMIPATGERLTLHKAFQKNLISAALYTKLLERHDMCKDLIDPNTAEKIALEELLERTVVHRETGLRLLPVTPQERGKITLKCGRKITIFRAAHEGLIERETMFRLLGAQLLSGGIIHPDTGHRMSLEEAMKEGVIDQDTACAILTHQIQTGGIFCQNSSKRLTVDEAVQCNLISSSSALLVLQAQRGFIGLIWPHSGEIFPVSTSLHQGMITNEQACKILNGRQKIAAFYIPETCEVIGLDAAAQQGVIDSNTKSILNNVTLPDEMPNMDDIPFPLKKAARWLSSCELHPPTQHAHGKDASDTSEPILRFSEQMQKLFMSYLMINSCMDANTGQRLLLHCGDLNETVSSLMDDSHSEYYTDRTEGQFCINTKTQNLEQQPEYVTFSGITSNVLGQGTSVQNISNGNNKKEFYKDHWNDKSSGENGFPVVASGSEQSERGTNTLFCKQEDRAGKVIDTNQNLEKENAFRSLLKPSEQMQVVVCENTTNQANAGNVETKVSLSDYSQKSLPPRINEDNIFMIEGKNIKGNENKMPSGILDNILDINYSSAIKKEEEVQESSYVSHLMGNNMQKCMTCVLQTEEDIILIKKDEVNDDFQDSLYICMEPDNKLLNDELTGEELGPCNESRILQSRNNATPLLRNSDDNGNSESHLQVFIDANERLPLEYHCITHDACLHKTDKPPQEVLTNIDANPQPEDYANKFTGCLLEDHASVQDALQLEARDHIHGSLSLEDCPNKYSVSVLENTFIPNGHPVQKDNITLISGLQEEQIEMESGPSLESQINISDVQQPIDLANLCSVSLLDDHTNFEGIALLEYHTEEKYIGPIQRNYAITHAGIPLESTIGTNAGIPVEVSTESLNASSVKNNTDRESTSALEVSASMKHNEPSVDDSRAAFMCDRLFLESCNSKPSELLHERECSTPQSEISNDYKDPCDTVKDGSKSSDSLQINRNNDKSYNTGKIEIGDSSAVKEDVVPELSHSSVAIKGAADNPIQEAESSVDNLNAEEEGILCFSESNDSDIFEIINMAAFSAKIRGTILEEQAESTGDVEKGQKKGSEESRDCSLGKLDEAEMKKDEHERIRMKGEDDSESEHEILFMDNGSDNSGDNEDEDDFEGYDHVDFDYDTPDETDYEDEEVLEMHYSQCCDKSIGVQVPAIAETESKNIHHENNGLLCFKHYSVDEYGNVADVAKENIQDLHCKSKEESWQKTEQASESFLENNPALHSSQTSQLSINNGVTLEDITGTEEIRAELDISPQSNLYAENNKAKILDDVSVPCLNCEKRQEVDDGKSAQAFTSISHSQLEMCDLKQNKNRAFILKEDSIQESSGSFGEPCSSVFKNGYKITPLRDEKMSLDQTSNKNTLVTHANGFATDESVVHVEECNLSTYLKKCAKDVIGRDILAMRGRDSSYLKKAERDIEESGEELVAVSSVNSREKQHPEEVSKEASIHSTVCHDKVQSYKCAFSNMECVEVIEEVGNKVEARSEEHIHVIGFSSSTLDTMDDRWHSTEQKKHETSVSHSSVGSPKEDDVLDHDPAFFENGIQIKMQQPQKDVMLPNFHPVRDQEIYFSEKPPILPESLTNILKGKIQDGHVYCKQEDEPLSYIGTRALMQNLLKMVNCTPWGNEDSSQSDIPHISGDTRTATSLSLHSNEHNSTPYICLESRSPDLLIDILKQDHCSQRNDGIHETMDMKAQTEREQDKKTSQYDHDFPGCSSQLKVETPAESTGSYSKDLGLKEHPSAEEPYNPSKSFSDAFELKESVPSPDAKSMLYSGLQQCSWYTESLRRHLTVIQDMKFLLDDLHPISNDLEALKVQLEQLESFESGLAGFAVILRKDMKLAEEFIKFQHKDVPREQLEDLKESYECLEKDFFVVCEMSSNRAKQIVFAVNSEMAKLAVLHQEHLVKLQEFTDWIEEKSETINNLQMDGCDVDVKQRLQLFKDLEKEFGCRKMQLESTALDIQFFISEHAQDLSPNQSKQLLRLLNTTQKHFQEMQGTIRSQVDHFETLLKKEQVLVDQKDLAEQHQEFTEKLQDICDLLTQTENQLIGHKESLVIEDAKAELQQYQAKQEELQRNMQANTQALAEIVKNTEMFLKENGERLLQEDKTALEKKLNEAKTKCLLLSQKAEESRKQLDKAMTTAIKQETEKVAAREQLEQSKSTIENLLDWLSDVDKDAENRSNKCKPAIKQNDTHFQEGDVEGLAGEEDEVNGNLLEIQQQNESHVDGQLKPSEDNLNMQYQKAKAQHEKIVSQQQAVIIATQSAQALLEKQGHHLSPEEKEKIQRNMKELKVQYETALAESEQKLKLTRSLQEELEKFDTDYGEFESWLQQAEQELDNLETGASDFSGIIIKLKRQKSFSEDVISHKGDLRYITISGQRVLDAAKSCNKRDGVKYDKEGIDTSSTSTEVQNKLDSATGRFKSVYSKCSILGNNLKDLVDKYQNYEDASSGLLSGLQACEEAVNKQLSEAVAIDPRNLQRQLEETKVLQGQVSSHQVAVEKLKKAAKVLFDTRGELLPDKDEIQNTLDTIVDKYNHLSKAVNDRNEKLQITLTRSLSVQDGLDEMLDWMNGVEKSLEEQGQVPLNSAAIQDVISKSMALEQDIVGRQSSLNAMKEKVNKFMETTDPSTASSLQAKMNELSLRFCEANNKHRKKLEKMKGLKTKVELFESLSDKLQSFLDKKTQALSEADLPGKDVTEMSLYVQETNTELMEQKKDLDTLQHLIEELSPCALPGDKSLVLEKVNALSKKFREMEETIREKKENVSSCQKQMDEFNLGVESLKKWIDEMTEKIPAIQPSLNAENLNKHLQNAKNLEEEWSSKAPDIQKMISRGTALCNLISAVISPARSRRVKSAVSGTVLNGEGPATGTQGFLTNKEVTTVQHNMSTINHSYDDLGAILKEKRSELESTLLNMQNIQEESNSMVEWLRKMDTAAAKWEATLLDSEAVKEQVDQHKLFETELKQNENKVQELKDRVTELLEKNPDSPEALKWKQMLEKIDSKWKELSQVAADRQKKLEESSNYLTQFQATEAQLKQWLVEKELMVSVLGPLSIDPNMLNTQKQQVQILLNEFDTRKPQYEQLTTAGQGILKRPGEHPPSHATVKQKLAAVAQKWDSLTGQLGDRCGRIDQAIVKSTEYQSCLRSLSEKLSVLDDKLSSSLAISTDPDSVKQQLEVAREVKEEIEQEMLNINVAQTLCEELSVLVAEDYLKAELARQLDGILKPFQDMEQKAGTHIEQLQSTYVSCHQFQQMSKDFQAWLDKKKEEQNQPRPISTKMESLWTLIDDQKEFKAALSDQIGSYEKIIAEGESLLQKSQGVEKAELQLQLNLLKGNWDELNKQVKENQDKLNDCLEKALRYKEHVENLQPWVAKCQSNLSEIKMSIDPVQLENSLAEVKTWQKDLDKHQGMVELLSNAAETFLSACQTDKDIIEEEKALLIQKMDMITEQMHAKKDGLEKMSRRLKEFQESSKEVKEQLKNVREQLEMHDSLKPQIYSNKHLTIMQTQQKTLQVVKSQVDLTKRLAQELVVDASDSSGVSELLLQAETLEDEFSAVSQQTEDKCSFLETKLQGIGHFQNTIREMFSQFAEFDDELDSMNSVGRDLVTLRSQQEDIKTFLKKLEELISSNEHANKTCKVMLANEAEASPDLAGIKRDLEALNKQCNKLLDRAKAGEEQIKGTINRIEEFYSKLKGFSRLLGEAEEHENSQGPVGMETETINQQLNVFKVFEKEKIEPLQVKQQEVNWLGQGLIQSAAKNASTDNLERDLEDVNTRWKTLNKKVAHRAAQLQEALLHCGRFQDAVESILSWLIDTEDLVANQKPPSAEFKVVKAQIQEQKLLQRLLDDRKPTVELIKREGEKIAESAEPADKEKILKQLSLLDSRWDALLDKAETRNRQLEGISAVAQEFHETLEPLVEWLTTTEKKLSNSEPIGTQASKLQQQISQHKAFEEDITTRNKNVQQAINIGKALKTMSSREDKEMVQEKLDSSKARYSEIQEKCSSRAQLLQQAYCNAQIFGEDEVELMNWLNEVHEKLSKLTVQDYNTDLLVKQHTEMLVLQEEILLRKQNVDQAIQNGLELLKQTTGDEVVIIQDKLEGIKTRYKDITKLSPDVSKTLEKALQLSGQLQSVHEKLSTWLDKVEVELLSYESQHPKGEELNQAQERQKALKKEAKENRSILDTLNEVSSALLELVPWRAREGIDKMVAEDNERYRSVSDTISQKVEEIDAVIFRLQQFEHAADTELAWVDETEKKLISLEDIRLERDQTIAQLQVQKAFTMEILKHKDTVEELVASGDEIMKTCTEEEKQTMKKKLESLLQKYNILCQMNSKRNLQLERAQSLVSQFWETYEEIWPWLTETTTVISQLPAPALEYETLKQQQEEHRQLRELIAEHKPHIDKMNKTGPQLLELSPREGFLIQEKYVAADALYNRIKEDVRKRAHALDEAISQSTQFHDKIDSTTESLERIVDRLRQPPSISAEVEKIKEQISENKNVSVDLEKLQPVYETLKQRGEEMIARSEGTDKDISAKVVQDKLDEMVFIWEDIHTLAEEREAKLLDAMELAEKFWCDHMALIATIKDTQDFIRELEGPGIDPSVVKQQQEATETIKEEIDGLQEELDIVVNLGSELIAACGEPDKPLVNKSIDELNSAWDALNKAWKERVDKLEEAMQAAVQYQDGLQAIFDWVDIAGSKLTSMSPVGTDLETVKQQTEELKQFKKEAYQQQIEMERLNHQAELLLKKVTEESDKHTVQDPLSELKLLWESLEDKIVSRQHKLEGALLALGQFQHALDELLTWLTHTEDLLNEQKPVGGDPKAIEIELAKHHVLQNDVLAHQSTVETVKKAGNDLIQSSAVEEASNLQSKLELLNHRWQNVLEKTEKRKRQLDSALIQAQGFHGEVEDLQQWLTETERQLLASKPVGGLPETAREQLNIHMELCAAFEAKEETYKCLMQKGLQMLARCLESVETNVEQDINNLKEKWESVETKLSERKIKLEEALSLAMEFHNSLQDFINWLTQAEQTLTMASRPSLILDTVLFQIDEHKVFANEVNAHRDQIIELDKTGTHLKYFSQKQDVVLIKNLLISVQSRWEKVVQRLVERGRALDDARKRAKQFCESWNKLTEWLDDSEKALDAELEIANDPDKIKMQLAQHKEFQKALGAKHSVYDTTNRSGRSLKEKTSLADDNLKLDDMLSELRDKWDTVCGKSVERQNKLEEALLFSGQFTDALQALIDWLYKVEPQLAEDQPVHGDIDLVMNLIDNHKAFQKELGKRTSSVQALKRSARELIEGSRDDSSWVKVQMQELGTRWETVCALSVSKQTRLEQALHQAEEFHSVVHVLLEWLAEAEQALRFHGNLPDDEEALRTLIDQHREFMRKLEEKKAELTKATGMGETILAICHPDSITTIKHWITIIRARFEEVLAWAKQHQQRLAGALAALIANQELLEALLTWLQWAETTLSEKDKEVIPQEIDDVKALIAEHQTFMEEMTRKQPDVDKVTKTHKRKVAESGPIQSHIPVLDKGRGGRKRSPTPSMYPSGAQAQIETKNPRVNLLVSKWQQVWLLALERRRKLNDALDRLEELKEFANFDFDIWRKKYMRWMNHKKSRVMDFFRRIDKDQDGKITRQEFIDGILSSKFPTSRLEMSAVADIFDRDGDGYIDYYEFVAALHPNKDAYKPLTDADKIEDEVTRQVAKCKCAKRFQVEQIGDNKYRFFLGNQFGDSQQLRLVRILRSTVMVRVGGGWMALDEFLVKNDPCRAKGRTNMELREKFILADGASQSIAAFRQRGRRSRPSSRGASPNRSTSVSNPPAQGTPTPAIAASTPKTPHHLTRNYGKPWLINSKTSSPCKPPECSEYQVSSTEGTPIQGSKLRLPGYLSGKGFHSGEDSGLISTAATRVRAHFADTRKTPSRPGSRAGSKTGSRASSRRGSDASDFDISEIQSVCSDVSETVHTPIRPTPRPSSRSASGKPSKIPTPQRRSPASKLDKSSKR
ncbi:dystonin isoform X28 [Rhineura floridana]|uniref:dystonin isoform X28 n=1 Tax=Rhineura floridana TaxID=261503 RepID=UPI002AC8688C|nr:dystonin isoform X28 [Rhineura floridana]